MRQLLGTNFDAHQLPKINQLRRRELIEAMVNISNCICLNFQHQDLWPCCIPYSIKKQGLMLLLFSAIISQGYSQSITVIDAFTQRPLQNVVVISEDEQRYCSSNEKGQFDMDLFDSNDLLTFQLMGYETRQLTIPAIIERKNIVSLFFDEKQLDGDSPFRWLEPRLNRKKLPKKSQL